MARFLTREWLDALAAEAAGSDRLCGAVTDIDLTVRQVVLGGPDGDVAYTLRMAHGTVAVTPDDRTTRAGGDSDDVDLEVVQDYPTAVAISRGDLAPAAAFAAGRIRLGGRVGLLTRHGDVVGGLGDLFASLRASTTY
ncbi:MAG TPA: hypothetical protein VHS52_10015 [Acidimicrobiales bacterium]|nr:hypothetical protein [Acidimicrobiales bacterium]